MKHTPSILHKVLRSALWAHLVLFTSFVHAQEIIPIRPDEACNFYLQARVQGKQEYFEHRISPIRVDEKTGERQIDLRIMSPTNVANAPIVVFSPGAGTSDRFYEDYGTALTEHGYNVVFVFHPGSGLDILSEQKLKNLRNIGNAVLTPDTWRVRAGDIHFAIDQVEALIRSHPLYREIMDPSRIAMMGHSLGASTSQMISGSKVIEHFEDPDFKNIPLYSNWQGPMMNFRDSRVKASVWISPSGPGIAFTEHSWENIEIPVLALTGTLDDGYSGYGADWRMKAFAGLPSNGNKHLAFIKDATHISFSNYYQANQLVPGGVADKHNLPFVRQITLNSMVEFLDGYLKGSTESIERLKAGKFGTEFDSEVRIESK